MKNVLFKDREFERNKEEILKMAGVSKYNTSRLNLNNKSRNVINDSKKYAWQYEIDEYRKRKNKEKFYAFGAVCGILSLIINIIINYSKIKEVFLLILKNLTF